MTHVSMRTYMDAVPDCELQDLDEGLRDYINLIGNALAGVASARHHGKAELQTLVISAKRNFMQIMGRSNQTWQTVQWKTLYRYFAIPNQFALNQTEVNKIMNDPQVKSILSKTLSSSKVLTPDYFSMFWNKPEMPIGGRRAYPNSAKRAEIVVTYLFELASMKRLESQEGAVDDTPPASTTAPASNATATAAATTSSTANNTTSQSLTPDKIADIKSKLATIKGTP